MHRLRFLASIIVLVGVLFANTPAQSAQPTPAASTGPITLTRELDTTENMGTAGPSELTIVNGAFYAIHENDANGREIWRSDGVSPAQVMIDLNAGNFNSQPFALTAVGNRLFFFDEYQLNDYSLWVSDGTAAGTQRVRSLGTSGSGIRLNAFGNQLVFQYGTDLWISDGTATGTKLVKQFTTIDELRPLGDRVLVLGATASDGYGLWSSDGTAAGTQRIATLTASNPVHFTLYENKLYFKADGGNGCQMYVTDGTAAGTGLFADTCVSADRDELAISGGRLYQYDSLGFGPPNARLRRSVPGTGSMEIVKTFTSGPITGLAVVGNGILFSMQDNTLWFSDGTELGTVQQLSGATTPTVGRSVRTSKGTLFIDSKTNTLWRSDGSAAGTTQVLISGQVVRVTDTIGFSPNRFVRDGTQVYVVAGLGDNPVAQIVGSDGTTTGTRAFAFRVGNRSANIDQLLSGTNQLVFTTAEGALQPGIWRSNGTAVGTVRQVATAPQPIEAIAQIENTSLVWLGSRGFDDVNVGLFRLDPSDTALQPVSTYNTANGGARLRSPLRVAGNYAYYLAETNNAAAGLFRTDGTPTGTTVITQALQSPSVGDLLPTPSGVYFSKTPSSNMSELYFSDGTAAGVRLVKRFTSTGSFLPSPDFLMNGLNGNQLYFVGYDDANAYRLWTSDGTTTGTVPLNIAETASFAQFLGRSGDTLYALINRSLYALNGADATKVLDFATTGSVNTLWSRQVGATLVFALSTDGINYALWRSDGTAAGTQPIFASGGPQIVNNSDQPRIFDAATLSAVNRIAFTGYTPANGAELWVTDGTAAGTWVVQNLAPGPQSSTPQRLTVAGDRLYMLADDGTTGLELYSALLTDLKDATRRIFLPLVVK